MREGVPSVGKPAAALQRVPVRAHPEGAARPADAALRGVRRLVLRAERGPQVLRRALRFDRGSAGTKGEVREPGASRHPESVGAGRRAGPHVVRPLRSADPAGRAVGSRPRGWRIAGRAGARELQSGGSVAACGEAKAGQVSNLAPSAAADARRILDQAARRLLDARLHADPVSATAGTDARLADDSDDQGALLLDGEIAPVTGRGNGDGGSGSSL